MTSFFYSRYLSADIGYERVFHVSGSNSNSNLPNFRWENASLAQTKMIFNTHDP